MKITKIESIKGSRKRRVYSDDSLLFLAYPAELRAYGIEEGEELSPELYEELNREVFIPRAKRRAMNLLVSKDRSRKELEERLASDGYPRKAAEEAVRFVESYHYLDDFRYAATFLRAKQEEKSKRQLIMKLAEKGISREVMDEAFEAVRQERMELMGDEFEEAELSAIRRLIRKKTKSSDLLSDKERQKLAASLYAKGFRSSDIRQVIDCECYEP